MFSVVIPLYNKAPYVRQAVESVLQQSDGDFEVIIVDDGSTDGSLEQLAALDDSRIRRITQSNAGVSAARNRGVALARYPFVAFLDADDWWDTHFLATMRTLVTEFPGAGLYGCGYYLVRNGAPQPAKVGVAPNFTAGFINYFEVYTRTFWVPINCSFAVVDKAMFTALGGFRPKLAFGEDVDLWIRLALAHPVGYVSQPLAYSNQDVDTENRALGSNRVWTPAQHVIFNLDHLAGWEQTSPALKQLLDGLRVRSLLPYYLNARYSAEVGAVLKRVQFREQPWRYRLVYQFPRPLVAIYYQLLQSGSRIKQALRRLRLVQLLPNLTEA